MFIINKNKINKKTCLYKTGLFLIKLLLSQKVIKSKKTIPKHGIILYNEKEGYQLRGEIMYVSSIGQSSYSSPVFGQKRLPDHNGHKVYELNLQEDQAVIAGLLKISEENHFNKEFIPTMQQFLSLSGNRNLECGYKISAEAMPDISKPQNISTDFKDIKLTFETDHSDSRKINDMHWNPNVKITYAGKNGKAVNSGVFSAFA